MAHAWVYALIAKETDSQEQWCKKYWTYEVSISGVNIYIMDFNIRQQHLEFCNDEYFLYNVIFVAFWGDSKPYSLLIIF